MRLKICDGHLTWKVTNKCLNVRERVEVVDWNKKWSPRFLCCPLSRQCPWKKTLIEKKNYFSTWDVTQFMPLVIYVCMYVHIIWITSWQAWFVQTFGSLHYSIRLAVLDACWIFSSVVVRNSLYLLLICLNLVEYY